MAILSLESCVLAVIRDSRRCSEPSSLDPGDADSAIGELDRMNTGLDDSPTPSGAHGGQSPASRFSM